MLVSVIMPTYNCSRYILQSLDSVIAQTITDWEVQIIDDCSTDNTAEVLKPYLEKYPNIHYYVLSQNSGPAVARTAAIKRATGKYIAFLDSDDLWKPDKLEKQIEFMKKTGAMNIVQCIFLVITHNFIIYCFLNIIFNLANNIFCAYLANKKYPQMLNSRSYH